MARKKKKMLIILPIAIILLILIIGIGVYFFIGIGGIPPGSQVNQGGSIKAVVVDANGNVVGDLNKGTQQTAIGSSTGTGYILVNNTNTFLAFQTQLDNTAGDSEITATNITGFSYCTTGNPNPSCSTIPNVLGAGGTGKGNLNALWFPFLPVIVAKGGVSNVVQSANLNLSPIEYGLIDFRIDVNGTYLDTNGNPQPLSNKFGKVTLRISPERCADNTKADPDSTNGDVNTYCSVPSVGKYCRISSDGTAILTDRASVCGCPSGQHVVGQTCVLNTGCTPNSCISGTVNYCLSGGQTVETRCQQCGASLSHLDWCPLDANSQAATSCNPASSGVASQCVYPSVSGSSFNVVLAAPTINPVAQCGDGVKNGAEQCDTNDFGGASCTTVGSFTGGTLSCSGTCTYVTTACTSAGVKFRTLFSAISNSVNADEIAFITISQTCGTTLTKAGEYTSIGGGSSTSGTCAANMGGNGYTNSTSVSGAITSVTRGAFVGTLNPSLWQKVTPNDIYVVCADKSGGGYAYTAFRTSVSAPTISTSSTSVTPSLEVSC